MHFIYFEEATRSLSLSYELDWNSMNNRDLVDVVIRCVRDDRADGEGKTDKERSDRQTVILNRIVILLVLLILHNKPLIILSLEKFAMIDNLLNQDAMIAMEIMLLLIKFSGVEYGSPTDGIGATLFARNDDCAAHQCGTCDEPTERCGGCHGGDGCTLCCHEAGYDSPCTGGGGSCTLGSQESDYKI